MQVAALAAAVMIAIEMTADHWFYLYIVWFAPLVLVALFAAHDRALPESGAPWPRREREPEAVAA